MLSLYYSIHAHTLAYILREFVYFVFFQPEHLNGQKPNRFNANIISNGAKAPAGLQHCGGFRSHSLLYCT